MVAWSRVVCSAAKALRWLPVTAWRAVIGWRSQLKLAGIPTKIRICCKLRLKRAHVHVARRPWLAPRAHLDDLRSQRQHMRSSFGVSAKRALQAAGCSTAPAHASGHGLPKATGARRASAISAPAARCSPSQQAQQPDGSSAKRALRAAATPVPGTADHGRHSAAGRRRRSAGLPGAETEKWLPTKLLGS